MMYRLAIKMIGNHDIVQDIVQEAFVCLYEKRKDLHLIKNHSGWLYRTTYYKCIDQLKTDTRFKELETIENDIYNTEENCDENPKELLYRALNKLDDRVRFLVLLYSEGLSYKEMAEVTGIKFTSVGKTLSRALKNLEKELKEEYYELFE